MSQSLSTFCHINEYREVGFAHLHRMIVSARPLFLWSPSSVFLKHYYDSGISRVSPRNFLAYVDQGCVRVLGREHWLFDSAWRNRLAESFDGALWVEEIDDQLARWAKADQGKNFSKKRVIVAPPEDGYEKAEEALQKNPALSALVRQLVQEKHVPIGSVEKALRVDPEMGRTAAQIVLRDLRNHKAALELSGARIPVLDSHQWKLLEGAFASSPTKASAPIELVTASYPVTLADAALKFLSRLEQGGPAFSLAEFVQRQEHQEFCEFLNSVCDFVEYGDCRILETTIVARLYDQVQSGLKTSLLENIGIPQGRVKRVIWLANLAIGIVGLAVGLTPLGIAGISIGALGWGYGTLKRYTDIFGPNYKGPRWPFLFCFGKEPQSRKQIRQLLSIMTEVQKILSTA